MITVERGDTRIFTWNASSDPDVITFQVFSGDTVVVSHAAVQSGTGAWYAIVPFPSGSYSAGYYNARWDAWASSMQYVTDELVRVVDVSALDAGSYYANVADVRDSWASLNAAGGELLNASIDSALRKAHTQIDGYLSKVYTLPFSATPPLVRTLATDLALYRIASRQVPRDDKGRIPGWVAELKDDALGILTQIQSGTMDLVTDSGTAWGRTGLGASGGFWMSGSGHAMTFTELDPVDQRVDPDREDDIKDEVW